MTLEETIAATVRAAVQPLVEEIRELRATVRPAVDGFLCVEKAAAFVDVHPDTIRAWVKAKHLPEHRAGRELRVRLDELRAFLDRRGADDRLSAEDEAARILNTRREA